MILKICLLSWIGVMPGFAAELVVEESSHAGRVFLPVGGRLVVRLPGDPTTGYSWEVVGGAGKVAGLEGKVEYLPDPSPKGMAGSGGTFAAAFKIRAKGRTTLQFAYRRPWEKGFEPSRTFDLEVVAKPHHLYRYRARNPGDDEIRVRYRFDGGKRGPVARIAKDFKVFVRVYQP